MQLTELAISERCRTDCHREPGVRITRRTSRRLDGAEFTLVLSDFGVDRKQGAWRRAVASADSGVALWMLLGLALERLFDENDELEVPSTRTGYPA